MQCRSMEFQMSKSMPPVPPANRSNKGTAKDDPKAGQDTSHKHEPEPHTTEQGDTANIMQNTTNKGPFRGGRMIIEIGGH